MADIWCGHLVLSDGNIIKDIGLASSNSTSVPAIPPTSLRFLSTVDPARIPLYLAIGPSLDVWTTSEETEAWFESIFFNEPEAFDARTKHVSTTKWWDLARSQSPIGVLVQVQNDIEISEKPCVTEILFYGTIAACAKSALPTPPSSSPEHLHGEPLPALKVHALPLSSHLLRDDIGNLDVPVEPQFLPTTHISHTSPPSPKRGRDIFEEATIASKKARGRGGQGVAAAAARGLDSQQRYTHRKSFSNDTKPIPASESRPGSAHGNLNRSTSRQLSRSSSVTSEVRPSSRKGVLNTESKRSNLSQVVTVPLHFEEPTTESRNKDALSKVVMAAMRMHGLQQRKKNRSRRASVATGVDEASSLNEGAAAEDAAKDEEYKLIYHQTYKGAALALRKHMAEKPLHAQPDRMRDVVEKFLTIFLTDPLADPLPSDASNDAVATPGSKSRLGVLGSSHGHASPFDLPSVRRPGMNRAVTDSHLFTGSPMGKKGADRTDLTAV